jgi:predicted NUDIX family NTP pyrophosphohydrolase
MFRQSPELQLFLVHPGGPYFAKKDLNHWTIPKGEVEAGEELLDVAIREFTEETSLRPQGPYFPLGEIVQKGGKIVHGWAFSAPDYIPPAPVIQSNTCSVEWPPGSGKILEIPEADRGEFFSVEQARAKLKDTQHPFIERLLTTLQQKSFNP